MSESERVHERVSECVCVCVCECVCEREKSERGGAERGGGAQERGSWSEQAAATGGDRKGRRGQSKEGREGEEEQEGKETGLDGVMSQQQMSVSHDPKSPAWKGHQLAWAR